MMHYFFQDSLMYRKFKIEVFYDIINIFPVTFDQFNASLLNKSINFITQTFKR